MLEGRFRLVMGEKPVGGKWGGRLEGRGGVGGEEGKERGEKVEQCLRERCWWLRKGRGTVGLVVTYRGWGRGEAWEGRCWVLGGG